MPKKEIEITCPCCDTRLAVDVLTGRVMRSSGAQELDEFGKPRVTEQGWSDALGKVQERHGRGDSAFDDALRKEQNREKDLDDLFRQAHDKLDDDD